MTMNAGIILGGQTPDILGSMDRGRMMAESQIGLNRQNALAQLYKEQGAQIAAGDQGALNALAGFDPLTAQSVMQNNLGMKSTRLGMDQTRQQMATSAEDLAMRRETSRREAEAALKEQAASLTAEQLAAESAALSEALSGGAFFYQNKDKAGYDAFLASKGLDPAEFPFDAFPAHAASVEGVLEAMKAFAPPEPPKPADDYQRYVAEETAAGRQPLDRIGFSNALKGNGVTQTIRNPDGSETTIQVGGAAGAGDTGGRTGKPTEGSLASEGYLQRMQGAEEVFTALESAGTTALGWTDRPVVDTDFETMKLTGPEQQLLQAQRDWVRAKLRKESGAVIGPEEMAAEIKQYFPQPGEGPAVIAQKKESRKRAEEQLRITALLPEEAATTPTAGKATEMSDEDFLKAMGLE